MNRSKNSNAPPPPRIFEYILCLKNECYPHVSILKGENYCISYCSLREVGYRSLHRHRNPNSPQKIMKFFRSSCRCVAPGLKKTDGRPDDMVVHPIFFFLDRELRTDLQLFQFVPVYTIIYYFLFPSFFFYRLYEIVAFSSSEYAYHFRSSQSISSLFLMIVK